MIRAHVRALLTALGHVVVAEAWAAEAALAFARVHRPDAIAIDGRLGGGDLTLLLPALRAAAPAAAVFVIAAVAEVSLVRAAVAAGAAGAWRRPFSAAEINAGLQSVHGGA